MRPILPLPSPETLKKRWPAPDLFIHESRNSAEKILTRKDARIALILGPCSIHDSAVAIEYGKKLKKLKTKNFFPIMRLFIEKPRTLSGWKGLVYDPFLDGSNDIVSGLELARRLWVELAELETPCATELLDPLVAPYFDDLVVWGLIGARTSASQPHRQMASGLSFPVGFKNDFRGETDVAIAGILSSRAKHSHLGMDQKGRIAAMETKGNPFTHLVLRGSEHKTNFDPTSIKAALNELALYELEPRVVIDCSHGNSGKDHRMQKIAFESAIGQIADGNEAIAGLMLESQLYPGKQPLTDQLLYGVSITDSCMGWEETESLVMEADSRLSIGMSLVQK